MTDVNVEEASQLIAARQRMLVQDLIRKNITDTWVLQVMGRVPRHLFVREAYWNAAYDDCTIPISKGQKLYQPYVVALMLQSLRLESSEKVLEIGTGSGYQAALLAELVSQVYTIEIRETFVERAGMLLRDLGYFNIHMRCGNGYFGWAEQTPFDAIMVTCAVDHVPPPLIGQLKDGGRLVIPLGTVDRYRMTLFEKHNHSLHSTPIFVFPEV